MPLSKLQFKPGINREGTNYSNEGSWYDGDKIRFRNGYPERIGGWTKQSNQFLGTARFTHDFITLNGLSYLFVASEKKVYIEESGTFYDITPYRRSVTFPTEVTGVSATTALGSVGIPFLMEEYDVSVEGTTAVGTVTVVHNSAKVDVEGLEAQAIVDNLESISIVDSGGLAAVGEIGTVTIFTGIITPNAGGVRIFETNAKPATAQVGTVTVVIEEDS